MYKNHSDTQKTECKNVSPVIITTGSKNAKGELIAKKPSPQPILESVKRLKMKVIVTTQRLALKLISRLSSYTTSCNRVRCLRNLLLKKSLLSLEMARRKPAKERFEVLVFFQKTKVEANVFLKKKR